MGFDFEDYEIFVTKKGGNITAEEAYFIKRLIEIGSMIHRSVIHVVRPDDLSFQTFKKKE